jgi:hypothetical protein
MPMVVERRAMPIDDNPQRKSLLSVASTATRRVPGDLVECGVYRGDSLLYLATMAADKQVYGLDSFAGFPPNRERKQGFTDTSLDIVKARVRLVDVAPALTAWAAGGSWADAPTCGWSLIDREFLRAGARRDGLADPLGGRPHVDLERLFAARLGASSQEDRDDVRARLGLPANAARHTALGDALDLITFCAVLRAGAPA